MRKTLTLLCVACTALLCSSTWAADRVQTAKGQLTGTIENITRTEVEISRRAGDSTKVPVNEIEFIQYDGEDPKLAVARRAAIDGRHADAVSMLNEIAQAQQSRPEVAQEIEYYQAFCAARVAAAGGGDAGAAGRALRDYVQKNPQSHHYYPAHELLGDLLVALQRYDDALTYYSEVAEAPWPDYKMRAGIAKGRSLRTQKKHDEALAEYEAVLALDAPGDDPLAEQQRLAASLGKAACLAELQQFEEAIGMVEEVIKNTPSAEAAEIHAQAYTTLGNCYRQAGRPKDALLAFLHVDLLYQGDPAAHAEALANLADLWSELGERQRAQQASQQLQELYANSPWAR